MGLDQILWPCDHSSKTLLTSYSSVFDHLNFYYITEFCTLGNFFLAFKQR